MNKILKISILILSFLIVSNCTENISYSGKIINFNEDINEYKTKYDVISNLGEPNYIDPIEEKYFYYSEKKISKNFYQSKILSNNLLIFSFNDDDTINDIQKYNLEDRKEVKIVKERTSDLYVKEGLLEKVFGGVGAVTPTNNP